MLPCRKARDVALGSLAVKVLRLEELLAAREAQLAEADESGQEWLADAHKLRQAVGDTLAVLGEPQHEAEAAQMPWANMPLVMSAGLSWCHIVPCCPADAQDEEGHSMRQELQALRWAALHSAAAPAAADPRLGAAVPGLTEDGQLQGPIHQAGGGQAAVGPGSAARQQPQSLKQQRPSELAAAGHGVAGQQLKQLRDEHLARAQASGTEQSSPAYTAEHAEASRGVQPAEPPLQPQASGRGSRQALGAPQDPQSRHHELLEAQRQVLARLERALQPSVRQAAQHGAHNLAQAEPDLHAVAPQASIPGSHGARGIAAAASAIDGSRLGHSDRGSTSAASSGAPRLPPRASHEEAGHAMQQLQQAEGWRHSQQHQGLALSQDGAAGADEGQQKRGDPGQLLQQAEGWRHSQQHQGLALSQGGATCADEGQQKRDDIDQPLQLPGRGSDDLADADCKEAAAAEERTLSLSQWQREPQGSDQQLMSGSAAQPVESARCAQDPDLMEPEHQWAAVQPAAASAVPGAADALQPVAAHDQEADHTHVEPAGDPWGGLEGAQHPGAAGESRPQHGLLAAGQAEPQQSLRPRAEQRHQPVDSAEASQATEARHGQQLRRSYAPQQQDRARGVPESPGHGQALEEREQPDQSPSARETAAVHGCASQGQQRTHSLPDMDVAEALQPWEGMAAHGQREHRDPPGMDAADALQPGGGLSPEEQELLELQQDMQELEAQMAVAARCGACGLTSCTCGGRHGRYDSFSCPWGMLEFARMAAAGLAEDRGLHADAPAVHVSCQSSMYGEVWLQLAHPMCLWVISGSRNSTGKAERVCVPNLCVAFIWGLMVPAGTAVGHA